MLEFPDRRIILVALLHIFVFTSCRKETEVPVIETFEPLTVYGDKLVLGGYLSPVNSDKVTSVGICYSEGHFPDPDINPVETSDTRPGDFLVDITDFEHDDYLYYRAFARYEGGVALGDVKRLYTPHGSVTDADGNVYATVKIGNQVWMAENLRVKHYSDGDPIQNIKDETEWKNLTTGAYCDYENDLSFSSKYGLLYNYHAVSDPRKLAPEGWRIPSFEDWNQLREFCGGYNAAGGKLKETGHRYWRFENIGATNDYGFSARASGVRDYNFHANSYWTYWWSSTQDGYGSAYTFGVYYSGIELFTNSSRLTHGISVRCIKDN